MFAIMTPIYRKFPLRIFSPYSKIQLRISAMNVRSDRANSVNKASASQTTSEPAFEAPELTDAMIAALKEIHAKGLTMEQINLRSLERMKGRGKYPEK